jgi:site-specific recombinase XerD
MRASHQPSKELARRYLLEIEGRIARAQVGIPDPEPEAPTVAELIERFLTEYNRPKIKDIDAYRSHARSVLRRVLPLLGAKRADALQPVDLDRLRSALAKTHAPASVRLTLAFLGSTFSWAVRAKLVTKSPLIGVEKPTAPSSIEYLSRQQVQAVLALAHKRADAGNAAARCLRAAVVLVLHIGLRRGELLGLRLQDLDLGTRRLTVARSFQTMPKSGKARHLQLPAAAVPALTAWLKEVPRHAGVVFPVVSGPRPRLGRRTDLLGLPELLAEAGCRVLLHPWHALRHTFASHFVMSGGNLMALQKILGHATIAQSMVYAHLSEHFLAGEVDKLRF